MRQFPISEAPGPRPQCLRVSWMVKYPGFINRIPWGERSTAYATCDCIRWEVNCDGLVCHYQS